MIYAHGDKPCAINMEGSVKLILERQEEAFARLTRLAVWVQNRVPVCVAEEKIASTSRDDVRREVAELWDALINPSGPV